MEFLIGLVVVMCFMMILAIALGWMGDRANAELTQEELRTRLNNWTGEP